MTLSLSRSTQPLASITSYSRAITRTEFALPVLPLTQVLTNVTPPLTEVLY